MFFIPPLLLKRSEPLAVIWRIVFDEKWKPSRKIILEVNVQKACELLLEKIPNGKPGEIKFSLYLLAQLSYGITLIVQKRGDILCRDMEAFIPVIRRYQEEEEEEKEEKEEKESTIKSRKDRKKRIARRSDVIFLDSSFETLENEHLKVVLDYSAITLHEDMPVPEVDILFKDDFGPLTAAEARQMEALLKEDFECVFESKSSSTLESKEWIVTTVPQALTDNKDVNKTIYHEDTCEMMEVTDESELRKERQYDLGSDEAFLEREIQRPSCLSALELSEVHDSQIPTPKKKRRKQGTVIDEDQLQAQIDNSADLLHKRDEMIPQLSRHGMIKVQDLFDVRPITLREFAKNPLPNLDAWIAAPEYEEPPLQFEQAMQLEPMQPPPPKRMLHHASVERKASTESIPHELVKTETHDLEQQISTPVMEDIERGRRNTTSTAPSGGTYTADPSSQLRSDGGMLNTFDENRRYNEKMKISVAAIYESTAGTVLLREDLDDSLILSAEKARVTDLFSNSMIESELRRTRLESSIENVLIDEENPEYELRRGGCQEQNEKSFQKISVMENWFQLKADQLESTVETGSSSVPVYYQTQGANDLFGLITEFCNLHKVSTLSFSELVRGRSVVFVAKAFTNLLGTFFNFMNIKIVGETKGQSPARRKLCRNYYQPAISLLLFKLWKAEFEQAVEDVKKLSEKQDLVTKLKLYGLYKQATIGDVEGERPSFLSPSQAKYDAWEQFKGKSTDEARKMYIDFVNKLSAPESEVSSTKFPSSLKSVRGLDIVVEDKVFWIKLNRPNKYNALTWEMYDGITNALNYANEIDTTVTVLAGSGEYFCSGNDLSNFTGVNDSADIPRMASRAGEVLNAYIASYINHKKAMVALVNGPAIGIAVTVLPLFDLVIASDKATFSTPFTMLGQSPEGCSSYTFPMLMGHSKASEILVFDRKLTAQEAYERNLVCRVVPSLSFREEAEAYVRKISQLPPESLCYNKELLRKIHRKALLAQNQQEISLLVQRWQSSECLDAIKRFMARKK
uniref:ACB domain-containing protein n=1 Tax=Setaria digitata TaxID=48799 RepID=A0A915PTQ8_9BILA